MRFVASFKNPLEIPDGKVLLNAELELRCDSVLSADSEDRATLESDLSAVVGE